jgi:hypothetical protein
MLRRIRSTALSLDRRSTFSRPRGGIVHECGRVMEQISAENAFDKVEFAENPEPRVPCVLVVDTSASMDGR